MPEIAYILADPTVRVGQNSASNEMLFYATFVIVVSGIIGLIMLYKNRK